jgi:ribosomal RNA-processing protein 8
MSKEFRYYQEEADNAIHSELQINNKCIVKMFCGTGKSLLMRKCKVIQDKNLVVYVFPSLNLIDQFYNDYLNDYSSKNILKISSEIESTTEANKIIKFLSMKTNKIICITYQSFKTLLDNLKDIKINVCLFDEAHHAVGETYQKLIFENEICEKQIFFTATPKNANGIIMYDRYKLDSGICGKLVYDYSYLTGCFKGYLNPFEIRIDMYTEKTNKSVYESIARAIIASGNNRVLTFHSDVNTDRDTSVNNFVDENLFVRTFVNIMKNEFPEKVKYYKNVKMIGLSANINSKDRKSVLNNFDKTPDNEVIVISSCETIGEGIDTKNANMCVFVDPKSSYVKIIQNIGRIVRKQFGIDKPNSTILIPCWVDKTKYLVCEGDREKCDEVIRTDMSKDGNFNGILNVLSALKQEDEDLYDICLHYPDTFSPQELKCNLEKQGYTILEKIGEGSIIENMEHLLDTEIDYENYEDYESNEEIIMSIAEDNDVCVEIHTNSLENPIERYNSECESGEIIRLYKSVDEESEEEIYQPIVKKENLCKRNYGNLSGLKRESKLNVNVHTNPDVKVLWNISSDIDFTKDICSCIIDCEVVDNWHERLKELTKFIDENKRKPIIKNENEKSLSYFMSDQLKNFKYKINSMKNNIKYDLWKDFIEKYKEYIKSIDDIWYENFDEVKMFIDNNKKRPSGNSKENTEKILATWICNQQQNYKQQIQSMKDETKYDLWTEFLENYKEYVVVNLEYTKKEKSNHDIWYEKFEEVKIFIHNNKKRPSGNSKDNTEKTIGLWIGTQQQNYKTKINSMKDETKYELWTTFLEEYKGYFKSDDEVWYEKFEEVKIFIDNNKKRPSEKSKDNTEKTFGLWIGTQQKNYKQKIKSMKDETKYDLWNTFLEEYNEYLKSNHDIWYEKFEELKNFININKKVPSNSSKNKTDKILGGWLTKNKICYKNKNNCMKDETKYDLWSEFLEEYKEYLKSDDDIWYEKFEELKKFIDEHNRKPNIKNENEKSLSYFMSDKISDYNTKTISMKDETKYDLWTTFLEEYNEYFKSNHDIWYEKFEEVKTFIDNNKKRPSEKSKYNTEKTFGLWIRNHQRNYKKNEASMKDETKYNLWTEFLEEYKEYFDKSDTKSDISNKSNVKLIIEDDKESIEIEVKPKKKSMKLVKPSTNSKKESTEQKRQRVKSEISVLHKEYKTLKSDNLNKKFNEQPELWHKYHEISEENEKSFPEEDIPRNRIILELDKIGVKRTKMVVDMGCGKAQISQYFQDDKRFNFINYDHISSNTNIISCDISNIPLEEETAEICILSLAMWGSNCKEYIKEAHRILESNGILYINEATKRWSEKDENGNNIVGKEGNKLKTLLQEYGFQINIESIEKFCMFVCSKKV